MDLATELVNQRLPELEEITPKKSVKTALNLA